MECYIFFSSVLVNIKAYPIIFHLGLCDVSDMLERFLRNRGARLLQRSGG